MAQGHDPLVTTGSGADLTTDPGRLLREPSEELGGIPHFGQGVREGLSVLEHDQFGEVLLPGPHQVESAPQDLASLPGSGGRPRLGRIVGRGDCLFAVRRLGEADVDQHLLGGWVDHRHLTRTFDPLATDEETGLTAGLQLFENRSHPPSTSMGTVRRRVVPCLQVTPTRW